MRRNHVIALAHLTLALVALWQVAALATTAGVTCDDIPCPLTDNDCPSGCHVIVQGVYFQCCATVSGECCSYACYQCLCVDNQGEECPESPHNRQAIANAPVPNPNNNRCTDLTGGQCDCGPRANCP